MKQKLNYLAITTNLYLFLYEHFNPRKFYLSKSFNEYSSFVFNLRTGFTGLKVFFCLNEFWEIPLVHCHIYIFFISERCLLNIESNPLLTQDSSSCKNTHFKKSVLFIGAHLQEPFGPKASRWSLHPGFYPEKTNKLNRRLIDYVGMEKGILLIYFYSFTVILLILMAFTDYFL